VTIILVCSNRDLELHGARMNHAADHKKYIRAMTEALQYPKMHVKKHKYLPCTFIHAKNVLVCTREGPHMLGDWVRKVLLKYFWMDQAKTCSSADPHTHAHTHIYTHTCPCVSDANPFSNTCLAQTNFGMRTRGVMFLRGLVL
jgi:hypothetical protein